MSSLCFFLCALGVSVARTWGAKWDCSDYMFSQYDNFTRNTL